MSHFRADIEGLRAVAVLLVVGYHAGVPWLPGGYVGVDVFFVLSGYLITGLLASELERSRTISLRGFYARRARRLLPGLAVMMAATLLGSVAVLTPLERVELSATAIATALYASNLWFALAESDYFAADTRANPLLHTWSLGVEEQFYFAWPLIVLASSRLSAARWRGWALLGATLVLALATWRLAHGGWLWLALLVWPLSLAAA
ncbi:MAG TPA: acyltransferase, partial [Gemmatimonadaceae bacterium]|nr:acyltransferase [Gemmatimonadaceae bacterium]